MGANKYESYHEHREGALFKKCNTCLNWFEANYNNFEKDKNAKSGLNGKCRTCQRNYNKEQYLKDRENRIKKAYQRILNNRESHLESLKKNNARQKTKEMVRKGGIKYRKSDKYAVWKDKNKDRFIVYSHNHRNHNITKNEWKLCKVYFDESCAYCGLHKNNHYVTRIGKKMLFDLHKEHVVHNGANDLSNCIPSCSACNSEKNTKDIDEWYNESNVKFNQERYSKIIKWLHEDCKLFIEGNFAVNGVVETNPDKVIYIDDQITKVDD
ncbi:HNH endonuclease [Paenibacillus sp. ISL-20]|uniref:HNH endonuclease n=1 Tax=Paenibacillus sp. ISL-20 TaxID=2819163 RepID=UPI001BECC45A|nr:HNH endonuclease [Paenibacillus sp. ISL-20]MBT2759953.1 HNH endonuclease [Paenibacillus sp. ISL-20]